mmetsp:Transcript_72252/g.193852  ORF Transcript_72252/g.193852 Transcript_72252/m.193852 type:complete len:213 (+) Transcript_72252:1-639(+)
MCHCRICRDACLEASKCVHQFMGRPLSTYVVGAFVLSALEIYCCFIPKDDCDFDPEKEAIVTHSMWLSIQIGFAVLNLIFAPYMQAKVWKTLMQEIKEKPQYAASGKQVVPKAEVQDAFKKVFCEDFGVLFYFFASIMSLVWCYKGMYKWGDDLEPDCSLVAAASLGQALVALAFVYTFCWYCCPCCAKAIELEQQADHHYDRVRTGEGDSD